MGDNEKLTPERAIRLLRAKGGELENKSQRMLGIEPGLPVMDEIAYLTADIALIAQLLADHIERSERVIERLSILAEITQPEVWGQ